MTDKDFYQYAESGLSNVYITAGKVLTNDVGEKVYEVGNVKVWNTLVAFSLITKPFPLSSPEIRYLRKYMRMTQSGLATLLSKTRVTASRWENGTLEMDKNAELVLRLTALELVKSSQLIDMAVSTSMSISDFIPESQLSPDTPYVIEISCDFIRFKLDNSSEIQNINFSDINLTA